MKIRIATFVESSLEEVKAGFNEQLFLQLSPPFPTVQLKRFDGSKTGDQVSLELNFILFKQTWTSDITADEETDSAWVFVDEGVELPFFLSRWQHQHEVHAESNGATIVDDIDFNTGWLLTDILMYPAMYLQFLYRKPIYRKVFAKK